MNDALSIRLDQIAGLFVLSLTAGWPFTIFRKPPASLSEKP